MAVDNAGATILQANTNKLRGPLDTVDLEELPDSRERAGAPVLWPFCEGQIGVWEMFSDNSYLSGIVDRQRLQVATPIDLRIKKAESFSQELRQGFWQKLKKIPRLLGCPRLWRRKASKRKKSYGNSIICVWPWQNIKFLTENTSLF